jgi:cephalosporin hydroxylase
VRDLDGTLAFCRSLWTDTPKSEKLPEDLARHEILIERVKPAVVVETGLHWGYGARWWAQRVPHVVTVERDAQMVRDWHLETYGPRPLNVTVLDGDSLRRYDDTIAELAPRLANGGPILVVLDSDHGREHVHAEMERYGNLVTPGSYMVVEDGIYHHFPPGPRHVGNFYEGDPLQACERFLADHEDWEVDEELEDLYDRTMNPLGWLRRT